MLPAGARPLARRAVGWAFAAHFVPLFPLYALSFAHAGLSDARIGALFAIWSAVGLVTETPTGALADRFSRRRALVTAGIFEAAGFALWTAVPAFASFAAGFALWAVGEALASGAVQALVYDGLAATGAERHYPRLIGRIDAAALLAQPPTAAVAALLFHLGGFTLVGWASVASCLLGAALAGRLPEPPRRYPASAGTDADAEGAAVPCGRKEPDDAGREAPGRPGSPRPGGPDVPVSAAGDGSADRTGGGASTGDRAAATEPDGYLATLRAGIGEAVARPGVRGAVLAVAALTGLDALEEYFPLLARAWGVPTALNPLATLGIPLAGAAGAALAAAAARLSARRIGLITAAAAVALGVASVLRHPLGLGLVAVFYGLYRLVLVRADATLQARIDGAARATVTSAAGLGAEFATFALYGAWTLGGLPLVTAQVCVTAALLPRLLHAGRAAAPGRRRRRRRRRRR